MTLYIVSNACLFWMFVLIGVTFAYLGVKIRKRGMAILLSLQAVEKAHRVGAVMCCVFIFCAGGHLLENVGAFWWPAYRFFALWHLATLVFTALATLKIAKWGIRMIRAERALKILESAKEQGA